MSETEIQAQILQYLKAKNILHWRMPLGAVRRKGGVMAKSPIAGFPDIAGIYKGRFFALEVKAKAGKLSSPQAEWIQELNYAGAFAVVVRSVHDVINALLTIERGVSIPFYR